MMKALKNHFLFKAFEEDVLTSFIDVMEKQVISSQTMVFNQGDAGDCFYIATSGQFNVGTLSLRSALINLD